MSSGKFVSLSIMRHKKEASKLNFGTQLCEQAEYHIDFLKAVDSFPDLKKPSVLRRAVYRYEEFWLPLAADYPNECLSAPLDIEWAWHCHMLAGIFYKVRSNDIFTFCTKSSLITLENITLTLPSTTNPDSYKKIKLTVSSAAGPRVKHTWFSLKRPGDQPRTRTITWKNIGQRVLDTKEANNISFWLLTYVGWGCCGSKTDAGSNVVNLLPEIESTTNAVFGGRIPLGGTNILIHIQGQFTAPKRGSALMFLDQGQYETAVISENDQQLLGPVSLERLPSGTDNRCQVASHRLKNHLGDVDFTARTVHSQPLMMSVIQVFYHDKMSVIGHLIGSDQLPLPTQVAKDVITLNPVLGERAVLLKNDGGDWGILTGR